MVQHPRKARLGVRLWWIVPSALVAALVATEASRQPSALIARAKPTLSAVPPTRELAQEIRRAVDTLGGAEEQDRDAGPTIHGPKLLDDLRPPLLERKPVAPAPVPTPFDGLSRSALEELFDRPPTKLDWNQQPSRAPAPATLEGAAPAWNAPAVLHLDSGSQPAPTWNAPAVLNLDGGSQPVPERTAPAVLHLDGRSQPAPAWNSPALPHLEGKSPPAPAWNAPTVLHLEGKSPPASVWSAPPVTILNGIPEATSPPAAPAPSVDPVQTAAPLTPTATKPMETEAQVIVLTTSRDESTDHRVRPQVLLSAPPETMGSPLDRDPTVSAPMPRFEPAAEASVDIDVLRASYQTEEPPPFEGVVQPQPQPLELRAKAQPPEPAVKAQPGVKTVRQLVREIFTPAELPKAEVAEKPKQPGPAAKSSPGTKGVHELVRDVLTPAKLPKSEASRPPLASAKPDTQVKKQAAAVVPAKKDDSVQLPQLPEIPVDFGKMDEVDYAVRRAIAQTTEPPHADSKLRPVSGTYCLSCGRHGGLPPHDIDSTGRCSSCGHGGCVPGRKACYPCESHTRLGGFLCDLYDCICCPDPCYDPKWVPLADAAFFAEGARPVSQMRYGWDSARNLVLPDRSEFFWARADGKGLGPAIKAGALGEKRVRYEEMTMYTETAVGGFSTFVEMPYRSMDPDFANHAAGFGDMSVGTKSLLFDCELLLITFQFKTMIPMGTAFKGLGTGHTTLEPSLLFALKLSRDTYIQGQLSEWIPLGGNPDYAGSVFHSHFSVNHVLCRLMPDVPLVGTMEINTWTFQDGSYTDPIGGAFQRSSGETYVSLGPGLRLFICDKVDFGVGSAFAMTENHFAHTLARMVFRFRF